MKVPRSTRRVALSSCFITLTYFSQVMRVGNISLTDSATIRRVNGKAGHSGRGHGPGHRHGHGHGHGFETSALRYIERVVRSSQYA